MPKLVGHLLAAAALAVAPIAAVAVTAPGTSNAAPLDCPGGQWWDPTANICRPLGEGPQPLHCENGWWWDPASNHCVPPVEPLIW